MKHIRKFNESVEESDLLDIEDLFKEIADEWNLGKMNDIPTKDDICNNNDKYINTYYLIKLHERRQLGKWGKTLPFDGALLFLVVDTKTYNYLNKSSSEFRDNLDSFQKRCEGIGYNYDIEFTFFDNFTNIRIYFY